MSSEPESKYDLLSPVFAEFGRVAFVCQDFEHSLLYLLSLVGHELAHGEDGALQATWDFHSKKTLGGLLKALRERVNVAPEIDAYLGEGVDMRNRVMHGFLTANAQRLYSPKGRLEVEAELAELKTEITARNAMVRGLTDAIYAKYGTSSATFEARAEDMWRHLNPKPPADPTSH